MFPQTKFLLHLGFGAASPGLIRVGWAAFLIDEPKPGLTTGPFVALLHSENLATAEPGRVTLQYEARWTPPRTESTLAECGAQLEAPLRCFGVPVAHAEITSQRSQTSLVSIHAQGPEQWEAVHQVRPSGRTKRIDWREL